MNNIILPGNACIHPRMRRRNRVFEVHPWSKDFVIIQVHRIFFIICNTQVTLALLKCKVDILLVGIWTTFSVYQEFLKPFPPLLQVSHCPYCLLNNHGTVVEQSHVKEKKGKKKAISCSSMEYKCNFAAWLLDCSNLLRLN